MKYEVVQINWYKGKFKKEFENYFESRVEVLYQYYFNPILSKQIEFTENLLTDCDKDELLVKEDENTIYFGVECMPSVIKFEIEENGVGVITNEYLSLILKLIQDDFKNNLKTPDLIEKWCIGNFCLVFSYENIEDWGCVIKFVDTLDNLIKIKNEKGTEKEN